MASRAVHARSCSCWGCSWWQEGGAEESLCPALATQTRSLNPHPRPLARAHTYSLTVLTVFTTGTRNYSRRWRRCTWRRSRTSRRRSRRGASWRGAWVSGGRAGAAPFQPLIRYHPALARPPSRPPAHCTRMHPLCTHARAHAQTYTPTLSALGRAAEAAGGPSRRPLHPRLLCLRPTCFPPLQGCLASNKRDVLRRCPVAYPLCCACRLPLPAGESAYDSDSDEDMPRGQRVSCAQQ